MGSIMKGLSTSTRKTSLRVPSHSKICQARTCGRSVQVIPAVSKSHSSRLRMSAGRCAPGQADQSRAFAGEDHAIRGVGAAAAQDGHAGAAIGIDDVVDDDAADGEVVWCRHGVNSPQRLKSSCKIVVKRKLTTEATESTETCPRVSCVCGRFGETPLQRSTFVELA